MFIKRVLKLCFLKLCLLKLCLLKLWCLKPGRFIVASSILASSIVLCACQSNSSSQSNSQESQESQGSQQIMVDYSGIWMTPCLSLNDRNSSTVRLELNDGEYHMEFFSYDGQDCNSIESRDFSEIETGTYLIGDTVDVPSGVIAHGVTLFVESRETNGEQVSVSDQQTIGDIFHRDGNRLFRATGRTVGVAAVFIPEAINFFVEYYLQEE